MSTRIRLDQTRLNTSAWPRARLDDERVAEFMELYEEGCLTALPPVQVIERADDYLIADGWHRAQALVNLGIEDVLVEIVPSNGRDPVALAYEIGLRSSAMASKTLTRAEKHAAVQRLTVEGGRTDQEIAALVGVARTTVGRIRTRESALHTPEEPVRQRGPATADELAQRLVRDLGHIWDARGITDIARDRLPRNLATALRERFGDDEALVWARRLAAWASDAVRRLEQGVSG